MLGVLKKVFSKNWTLARSTILLLLIMTSRFVLSDVITLVADEWCPYNCAPDGVAQGFIIEIAEAVYEPLGYSIEYKTMPWARAIYGVREGHFDGLVGVGKKEAPDLVFASDNVGEATHVFFVKRGRGWRYKGLESLDQIILGAILNYSYGQLYDSYIVHHKGNPNRIQLTSGEHGLSQNINKLMLGRIDAVVEDRAVFRYTSLEMGVIDNFVEVGTVYYEDVHIAFSPKNDNAKEYAKLLSDGIKRLRASGKLASILSKYGLEDWAD